MTVGPDNHGTIAMDQVFTMNTTTDDSFGPAREGRFDFTLLFEQSIFLIGPSTLFLIAASFRVAVLSRRKPLVWPATVFWTKLTLILALFILQVANLVLWTLPSTPHTRVSTAAAALSLTEIVAIGALLSAEHRYSRSPSILLSIYLSVTILLNISTSRSLFLRGDLAAIGGITSGTVVLKLLLLALEEVPKRGSEAISASKELSSGLWNRSVFWWLHSTFRKGFSSFLNIEDLSGLANDYRLNSPRLASRLERRWQLADRGARNSLFYATFRAFQSTFWAGVIPRLCFTGFSFAQPFLINTVINSLGDSNQDNPRRVAGGLVGATAIIYIGIALSKCHYTHCTYRLIVAVRGGLVALIFARTFELDASTAKDSAAVTLMSTDIDGIASALQKVHDIWASILELGLAILLLERQIGPACFLILIPAVVSSLATGRVAKGMGSARAEWNAKVQKRVATTSSMLDQIKGIKMMGFSDRISGLIQSLRIIELDTSKAFRMFFVWISMIANLFDQLTPIVIITAAVFWIKDSHNLSVEDAFTILSIVALVSGPLVNIIAAYPTFVAGLACFKRIQTFLETEKKENYRHRLASESERFSCQYTDPDGIELHENVRNGVSKGSQDVRPLIEIRDASFSMKYGSEPVLQHVNLSIRRSTLTIVTGPVGAGKSALFKCILGEAHLAQGSVGMDQGPIAYCDQAPWLRLESIRHNILGPNKLEEKWFREVLYACDLEKDIAQFDDGDQSLIGSAGIALSGGQKQRVALARAVYSRASLVVLDDIFSALDQTTSNHVFDRLLGEGGLLRRGDATILLATHAVKYLSRANSVIMIERGNVCQYSSYEDFRSSESYIELSISEEHNKDKTSSECAEDMPEATARATQPKKANIDASTYELTRKTGDFSLYRFYLDSVGPRIFIVWLLLAGCYIFSGKMPQIWLRIWTENGTANHATSYLGGYLGFGLLCTLLSGACMYFYMIIAVPRSAQHLHWLLLKSVTRAPLWFFTTTDSSTLLNRFSQDMTLVDQVLPMAVFTTTFDVYNVIAGTAIVASGATYAAAIIPICMLAIWIIQKFYLRTSRQMRHLDLEAKSPLYRLFTETAAGVATIRAFGWEKDLIEEHMQQLDRSQTPYYMMYCIQRWLNVVLDLLVAAIAVILVGFALGLSNTATKGSIGLALLNVMEFNTSLSMLVNSWTGLETSLGAIARLKTFVAETKAEDRDGEDDMLPQDWPRLGAIQMKGVTAKYDIRNIVSQPAVRDVSLDIRPGQAVSIVGRTGSGKSSLILTLLHLLDIENGQITIDGVDLAGISRQALRAAIVTIPQDPVEMPGSVRFNLSSFTSTSKALEVDEKAMEQSLERVGLWEMIHSRGGLDCELDDAGLSGGQKQLFALARAVFSVRNRKVRGGIVLLDEPTSSVDEATSVAMWRVLQEEFATWTIITVTHRDDAGEADVLIRMEGGQVGAITKKNRRGENQVN